MDESKKQCKLNMIRCPEPTSPSHVDAAAMIAENNVEEKIVILGSLSAAGVIAATETRRFSHPYFRQCNIRESCYRIKRNLSSLFLPAIT